MTHRSLAALAVLSLSLASLAAAAQDAPTTVSPAQSAAASDAGTRPGATSQGVQTPSQNAALYRSAPVVRLFGLPAQLQIDAPVDPSYAPTAFRTFGGQAETSADAVADQNTTWR